MHHAHRPPTVPDLWATYRECCSGYPRRYTRIARELTSTAKSFVVSNRRMILVTTHRMYTTLSPCTMCSGAGTSYYHPRTYTIH